MALGSSQPASIRMERLLHLNQAEIRVYADKDTQAACEAFNAGAQSVARMFYDSTIESEAFRAKMRELAGRK
jgi:hypothetical protein